MDGGASAPHAPPLIRHCLNAAEEVAKGAIIVTADVVEFYPSIARSESLDNLRKQFEKYPNKNISTEYLGKMAAHIFNPLSANPKKWWNALKIRRHSRNLFEFDSKSYKQISGAAIGTKFAPLYPVVYGPL